MAYAFDRKIIYAFDGYNLIYVHIIQSQYQQNTSKMRVSGTAILKSTVTRNHAIKRSI